MRARPSCWFLLFAFVATCGCAPGEPPVVEASPAASPPGEGATPLALEGEAVGHREAQRRAALRGIRYDGEVARVDPEEAAGLVAGPDADASARALAEGRELLARNAIIEGLGAHTRAVLLAPEDARAWLALGEALTTNRRGEMALAAYRAGIELEPRSPELREGAARALAGLGRRTEAVAELRAAVELDPARASAFSQLAIQSYYLEDDAAAWTALRRAEELGESVPPQFRALLAKRSPEELR